jgi:D-lactate dehydrogenase
MEEMCHIVATKHSGSLKGEHGTGRNVAPFVEMEWGSKAYELMWELKELFDPGYVLNPSVILNRCPFVRVLTVMATDGALSVYQSSCCTTC